MKIARRSLIIFAALAAFSTAQSASPPKKHLLVIGEEKGYRHDAVSHAMATIERLGLETGLWDATLRTDTEALTKRKLEYNAKNLNDFDAVLFFTGGNLEMDAQKKADFQSFIHDEGKGFIGVHSAAITFVDWPEFVEMVGGTYDEHPWTTFDAPILVEDPGFPGMQQFPHAFTLRDEIYQMKDYSRAKVRVLMRLDVSKLDMKNKNVHRTDANAIFTLDGQGFQTTLLLAEPDGSTMFRIWNQDKGSLTMGVEDNPFLNLKLNGKPLFTAPADNPESRDQRPLFR